jgi:3-hydroxyacyl-CoA dehydrogenase
LLVGAAKKACIGLRFGPGPFALMDLLNLDTSLKQLDSC